MSDVEIEQYKKDKVVELESKIEEIKARETKEKEKASELKAEQELLITQFGSFSDRERETAIARGRQLQNELSNYDIHNQWGIFASLEKEMQEVREMQEQIANRTSQEIKKQLSEEIEGSQSFAQTIEYASKQGLNQSTKLLAAVASDPEKAQQMASCLTYYRRLSDEQSQIKGYLYLGWGYPKELERRLTQYNYYNPKTNEVRDPDKLLEIVSGFEENFAQAKNEFMDQFTEQKLSKLYGREYGEDSSEVDLPFLQQHSDKLGEGTLTHLQNAVERRDKLSKKIFKTRDVKDEIASLNEYIKQDQSRVYREIIGWYRSQSQDILGISYGFSFYDPAGLQSDLEKAMHDIDRSQEVVNEIKAKIQKVKVGMDQQDQNYEKEKHGVLQQIRTLGGAQFAETDIPYVSDQNEYNLDSIVHASSRVYEQEIIQNVQQEAQTQADTRESELKGVTV